MPPARFSLADLLLLFGATPIWIWLIWVLPQGPGWGGSPFRFYIPPFVLFGLTVCFYLLIRPWPFAWGLSALIAGLFSTVLLYLIAALS